MRKVKQNPALAPRSMSQPLQEDDLRELSIAHKRSLALSLAEYVEKTESRNEAMAQAYRSGAYTMAEIADYFAVHYMTVSRAVQTSEV